MFFPTEPVNNKIKLRTSLLKYKLYSNWLQMYATHLSTFHKNICTLLR
jgi:hypothetical protein